MNFNQFVFCCLGVATALMLSGFFWLGLVIMVIVVGIYSFALYIAWDMIEFWSKLSTVWQDVPEVITAGEATWFSKRGVNANSIGALYRRLSMYKGLFEVKVDETVIDAFERLHPDFRLRSSVEIPALTRAMIYVVFVFQHKPEYLPDIQRAVLVRKKVGGKKKPTKAKPIPVLCPTPS